MRRMIIMATLLAIALFWLGCGGDKGGPGTDDPCSITIVSPTASTSALAGETLTIRWEKTGGAADVRIELLQDGVVVGEIETSTPNDGFDPWFASVLQGVSGDGFSVLVTALGESGCADESETFTILDTTGCALELTFEDTLLEAGTEHEITWTSQSTTGFVDILLDRWDLTATIVANTEDDGSYTWTVDSFHYGTGEFTFVIHDHDLPDCRDESQLVEIRDDELCLIGIGPPWETPDWNVGETMTIHFSTENSGSSINVMLYAGDTFLGNIRLGVAADAGTIDWVVDDFGFSLNNDRYNIRMVDAQDEYCIGESVQFTIWP